MGYGEDGDKMCQNYMDLQGDMKKVPVDYMKMNVALTIFGRLFPQMTGFIPK